MYKKQIIKQRLADIRRRMKTGGISALLLTSPANVTYLSGFLGEDSWLLVVANSAYLITDSRYTEQAHKECHGCKIVERTGPMPPVIINVLKKYKSIRSLAVESSISMTASKALKKSIKKKIKPVTGLVEDARRTKTDDEVKVIKLSAQIASQALKTAIKKMKPGITESELAGLIEYNMRKLGARPAFDTIVAFGPNASRPHHQSGQRKLKKKDTVLIDFGARFNGYCSDMTRCFSVGKPVKLYGKVYKAVLDAQTAAIAAVKPGASLKSVDQAARKVIRAHGFTPHGHGTGHGLGLEVHEQPTVGLLSRGKLRTGDVITIEPGIYIPGKLGVRIEDDVLVTKTIAKILTKGL
ncbi:MAG: Xaa-Pro peptidase family protein [Phycisphaerae bacterium]|jgi:Xaa-Pro aminopeptidase